MAIASLGPGSSFTIADFDGDNRPDFVSVDAERIDSSLTIYAIQLQLSTSGQHSIQVVAPSGGLQIEAQDVDNGNHYIDLVLTTAWFKRPVAILINDGQGRFSPVEPTAFPDAFTNCAANSVSIPYRITDAGHVPPQRAPQFYLRSRTLSSVILPNDFSSCSSYDFLFGRSTAILPARAPPFLILS